MSSNIKVLQVIPKLGYGGAETGCYDIAHYLPENNCKSFIVTSGGELIKFIDREKVKLISGELNNYKITYMDDVKIGVLTGSLLSTLVGYFLLLIFSKK